MTLFKKYYCPDCDRKLKKMHISITTPLYCCWHCKKVWLDTELECMNKETHILDSSDWDSGCCRCYCKRCDDDESH